MIPLVTACDQVETGIASGEVQVGLVDGDLGIAHSVCPTTRVGFTAGGAAIVETENLYGRILGTLFVNGDPMSLNDRMVGLGYAWGYDGGTKVKDLGALALRKLHPTVPPLLVPVPTAVQA